MEAQCVPVWSMGSHTFPCPFEHLFSSKSVRTISDAQWKQVAGNAQHLACVGNLLAFTLSTAAQWKKLGLGPQRTTFRSMGSSLFQDMQDDIDSDVVPTLESASALRMQRPAARSSSSSLTLRLDSSSFDLELEGQVLDPRPALRRQQRPSKSLRSSFCVRLDSSSFAVSETQGPALEQNATSASSSSSTFARHDSSSFASADVVDNDLGPLPVSKRMRQDCPDLE